MSTFQKRWVAVFQGVHPFEFVSAVLTIYVGLHRPTGCHTLLRNEHFPWGTILAKFCLCCNRFILLELIMLKVAHLIQHLPIHPYLMCSVFPFLGGTHVHARFNPYFPANYRCWLVSRLVIYVHLSLDPAMRSMLSPHPPTAMVPMKPSNTFVLVCSKKMSGLETKYNFSELLQLFETI